ncbi:type VI secretion system lipoprotein TssJ [Pantoea sp. Al-1710]|jgi:type VI secretion system protein VasD|uniref:Type VI secretion system lipoprotein TssJ n=1 Tax=Candidatus Pantoea communis TaxID=2608354 RepID=A0ABX0RW57_9GAMM|nr:type VI secretion system lipoprotein TssJ [Pantoea communis]MDF7628790.1 type VI secretion system lipoprotein TssJ [Erwiniaceae bacterium L1_55_4]NIG19855.1 type VI secretion system lipoprotein TssJ [Pantoea communis]
MAVINFKFAAVTMIGVALLSGCGLTQSVSEGTASMTRSIFYKKITTLHLDFTTRSGVNSDEGDVPLATLLRVYQLKDRQAFDKADYQTLLTQADSTLKGDLLAQRDVTVMPGGSVSLDVPMDKEAKYVAVVGLFRSPDLQKNSWRLVLDRDDLDADDARVIVLGNGDLALKHKE